MATREARILSNPLRVQILGEITAQPATRAQLAASIGASLASVGYHTKVLCNAGCARAVEQTAAAGSRADLLFEASP